MSKIHSTDSRKITRQGRTCAACGAEFERHLCVIVANKSGKFYCSQSCRIGQPSSEVSIGRGGDGVVRDVCAVPDCNKKPRSNCAVYCEKHYYRVRRNGNTQLLVEPRQFAEDVFDVMTQQAAWVLGLIWSDGNLSGRSIQFVSIDLQMMKLVVRFFRCSESYLYHAKNGAWRLVLRSQRLKETLVSYGLVERKSLIIKWPFGLEKIFWWSFIRGVFDGDGTVNLKQNRPNQQAPDLRASICSASQEFAKMLHETLSFLGVSSYLYVRGANGSRKNPLWDVVVVKQEALRTMYQGMYAEENSSCLLRKKHKFDEWISVPRGRSGRRCQT